MEDTLYDIHHFMITGETELNDSQTVLDKLKDLSNLELEGDLENQLVELDSNNPDELIVLFSDESNENQLGFEPGDEEGELVAFSFFKNENSDHFQNHFSQIVEILGELNLFQFHIGIVLNRSFERFDFPLNESSENFEISGIKFDHGEDELIFQKSDSDHTSLTIEKGDMTLNSNNVINITDNAIDEANSYLEVFA